MGKQALILCDMPNLCYWPMLQQSMAGERIGSVVFKTLERISRFFVETAEFSIKEKWAFGDVNFDGMAETMSALHTARWKYLYCPRKLKHTGRASQAVSVSDDIMKSVMELYLATGTVDHFVFISDDGDFAVDAMKCIEHGRDVTCIVSGHNTSMAIRELKRYGATIVCLDDIPLYTISRIEELQNQNEIWSCIVRDIKKKPALLGVLPGVEKSSPCPQTKVEIRKPIVPVNAVERFNRRYGGAQK